MPFPCGCRCFFLVPNVLESKDLLGGRVAVHLIAGSISCVFVFPYGRGGGSLTGSFPLPACDREKLTEGAGISRSIFNFLLSPPFLLNQEVLPLSFWPLPGHMRLSIPASHRRGGHPRKRPFRFRKSLSARYD